MANETIIEVMSPRLLGFVAQGKAFAGLPHAGVKGRLREILVSNVIEPFLPPTVSVLTGTIVATSGERKQRTQDDLVVFSREKAPLLLDGEQSVIPIEGVLAQIEVKTKLRRKDVTGAVLAATELRDLGVGDAPAGLIFSYQSDRSKASEVDRLLEVLQEVSFAARPGQATSPIQLICIADRGTWMLTKHDDCEGWWFVPPDDGHHLLAFASLISNTVYKRIARAPGVGDYLLDVSWLEGPCLECAQIVAKPMKGK